jgi:hypothetical protein
MSFCLFLLVMQWQIKLSKTVSKFHHLFLSDDTKKKSEKIILGIAIASFLIHLAVIFLVDFGFIKINNPSELLTHPIVAIYTPFSFILLYEVYLLIYYLPKSLTIYVSKQYEIMTLIIIRRLFKDLSNLTLSTDWFKIKYDLQFTYDLLTSIVMFFLIYVFYRQSSFRYKKKDFSTKRAIATAAFVKIKKSLATLLVPVFLILAVYSFSDWLLSVFLSHNANPATFSSINNIFFEQFFTILIFADVLLLLFSLFLTDEFHKVIRNSGFIISTILLRVSFSTTGLLNNLLIISAVVFGLLIIVIHNKFEDKILPKSDEETQ